MNICKWIKLTESNLRQVNVNTPEFRAWFRNSKVVDHEGNPLLVFRGTRKTPNLNRGFSTKRGTPSFTSSPDIASIYASTHDGITDFPDYDIGAQVTPCYLSIQNPVRLDSRVDHNMMEVCEYVNIDPSDTQGFWEMRDILQGIIALSERYAFNIKYPSTGVSRMEGEDLLEALDEAYDNKDWDDLSLLDLTWVDSYAIADCKTFVAAAKRVGYDGIFHMDVFDRGSQYTHLIGKDKIDGLSTENTHLTYRPFYPQQIKAAFNSGKWNAESPNMMETVGYLTIYRGEYSGNKGGYFWTEDKEFARQFTQSGRDHEILTRYIRPRDIYTKSRDVYAGDEAGVDAAIASAKSEGYKAVMLREEPGQHSLFVFDRSALMRKPM